MASDRPDEQSGDAGRGGDVAQSVDPPARLDHRQDAGLLFRRRHIVAPAAASRRTNRPEAARPARRVKTGAHDFGGLAPVIDHRDDNRRRAVIEKPAEMGGVLPCRPRHRRGARRLDRPEHVGREAFINEAVLEIDDDEIEAAPSGDFGDGRAREVAPRPDQFFTVSESAFQRARHEFYFSAYNLR